MIKREEEWGYFPLNDDIHTYRLLRQNQALSMKCAELEKLVARVKINAS